MSKKIKTALIGFGTVGEGLYKLLELSSFEGLDIRHIVVQDKEKKRSLPPSAFTYDVAKAITDPAVDLVIEAISDADAAFEIVKTSLLAGKHVITANKKMVASNLGFLRKLQKESGRALLYEGAVCGSIPIISLLDDYYGHERIEKIEGVFNGTSNFILSEMEKGATYAVALQKAQVLGLAEADPSSDVDAWDAKYKLLISVAHAFGYQLQLADVPNFGIRHIDPEDFIFAKSLGLKIRLKAVAGRQGAVVLPAFVSEDDPAFSLLGEDNYVQLHTSWAAKQRLFGPGAGDLATATALLGDVKRLLEGKQYRYREGEQYVAPATNKQAWYYIRYKQLPKSLQGCEAIALDHGNSYLLKIGLHELLEQQAFVATLPLEVVQTILEQRQAKVLTA